MRPAGVRPAGVRPAVVRPAVVSRVGVRRGARGYIRRMGIVIALLLLALIFGGIGLLVEGLFWLLIIALVLVVIGGVFGFRGRGRV